MTSDPNQLKKEKKPDKTLRLGLFAFILFLVSFFCTGYVIFPYFELSFNSLIETLTGIDWSHISGFNSLVTMSLVFAGLVFGLADRIQKERTEREEKAKLKYQYFSDISDRLTDPQQEEARRWIIDTFKQVYLGNPSPEEMAAIVRKKLASKPKNWTESRTPGQIYLKLVMNNLDYIGFIRDNYVEIDASMMEWMSSPIAKVWLLVGDYIEAECELRGEKDFYHSARRLGKACVAWRKERGLLGEFVDKTI
jgi:hypothetical protein